MQRELAIDLNDDDAYSLVRKAPLRPVGANKVL